VSWLVILRRFWWAIPLALLLVGNALTRHKLAERTAQLEAERTAHAQTIVNHQAAVIEARRLDAANVARVKAEQAAVTREITDGLEARLADARARHDRLRAALAAGAGGRTDAPVPGAGGPAARVDEAPGADGLPATLTAASLNLEERLLATEQALQLDALIDWIEGQAEVDMNGPAESE
jgi:hypothetical protein